MRNGPYELIPAPEGYKGKKYRGRYVYEHRLMAEVKTGYYLRDDEVVHHKNGRKRDNRLANLGVKLRSDHTRDHNKKR